MKILISLLMTFFLFSCNTDGVVQEHYETGELKKEYEIKNGERNGFFKYYREDGGLIMEYLNKDGKRHGKANLYYPTGEIHKQVLYKKGEAVWSKMYDHKGIQLNKYEGNTATFFSYYVDKRPENVTYGTENYSNINPDSLVSFRLDSGYYYAHEPNIAKVKVTRLGNLYLVADLTLNSEDNTDTVNSRTAFLSLKNKIIGKDTAVEEYIPTIHKK